MRIGSLAFLLVSLGLAVSASASDYTITKIALTGETWSPASDSFSYFNSVVLDGAGNVVFGGGLNDGSSFSAAQFSSSDNLLVTRASQQIFPVSAGGGTITMNGANDGDGSPQIVISNGAAGNSTVIAEVGSPAPGAAGNYTGLDNSPVTNGAGTTAYFGSYGISNTVAVWTSSGPSPALRVDGATLVVNGGPITYIGDIRINDSGTIALNGQANTGFGRDSIWQVPVSGSPVLLAKAGDAAPGDAGVTITQLTGIAPFTNNINVPVINNLDHIAFLAKTSASDTRIYLNDSSLHEIVRTGAAIPSIGSLTLSDLSNPVLNGQDRIAFAAQIALGGAVTTANDECLAITGPSATGLSLVAREGDSLASLGLPNLSLSAPDSFTDEFSAASLSVNASGDVAFLALVHDSSDNSDGNGLFVWDPTTGLHLVARTGDVLDGLTVANISIAASAGGQDGSMNIFNDAGQVAFLANFNDESFSQGVYLANLATEAPEPASCALLGLGALMVVRRRRAAH